MKILLVLAALLCGPAAWADALHGVVIVVIDGDTVLFKPDSHPPASRAFIKVRLAGIDAPEAGQPHGDAATHALKERILKQRARLTPVATDAYGRTLGRLEMDGLDVNAELVRQGHAWASSRDAADPLRRMQDEARRARRGLWVEPDPVPPWVWRRSQSVRPGAAISPARGGVSRRT
ncbi:MAG: thermonuclease family protein [Thiobacillus sp.]